MIKTQKNRIKALFLLAVFSFNTVVGFACSVGVDMGFNSTHHHADEATEAVIHIHADGKKHIHHEKKSSHDHNKSHHPGDANDKDNCCNNQVLKFEQLDKSVPAGVSLIHPIFLNTFFDVYYSVALPSTDIVRDIKQFVRSYHPPISDIRISIQSFQI